MIGIAARDRMVLQRPEPFGKGYVISAGNVLIAQEQHRVLQQRGLDRAEQIVVTRRFGQVHANQFRAFTLIGFLLAFQLIFGVLFGGLGVLLAAPLTVVAYVAAQDLYVAPLERADTTATAAEPRPVTESR